MRDEYEFDPDRIITSDVEGEPPEGYHICDGILDYYYDAKEHCYYYLNEDGTRQYTSAGFIEMYGGECSIISCAICCACIHTKIAEEKLPEGGVRWTRVCKVFGEIPKKIANIEIFSCEKFVPDKNSEDYDLVMKLMGKEQKNKLKS